MVSGKVQGVYFRQTTKEKAKTLNITGTVKNLPDGTVHITATGTADQLKEIIEWCWQGPSRARVSNVRHETCEPKQFQTFTIEE